MIMIFFLMLLCFSSYLRAAEDNLEDMDAIAAIATELKKMVEEESPLAAQEEIDTDAIAAIANGLKEIVEEESPAQEEIGTEEIGTDEIETDDDEVTEVLEDAPAPGKKRELT